MGRKKNDGDKLLGLLLLGLGGVALYYLQAGSDRENNAALIPDAIEGRIDRVVGTLNAQVGKNWCNFGAEVLKVILRKALPGPLVTLVDVVYAVEQESLRVCMASNTKRRRAAVMATARGLA